jgi:hypothetical protein
MATIAVPAGLRSLALDLHLEDQSGPLQPDLLRPQVELLALAVVLPQEISRIPW